MTDVHTTSTRSVPTLISSRWFGPYRVDTWRYGPDAFTAIVHPLGQAPVYFGLGETAKRARFEAWRYIAALQRRVEKRGRAA